MNNILTIAHREVFTRVRKLSFFLLSLLTPVIFLLSAIVPLHFSDNHQNRISIFISDVDETLSNHFISNEKYSFKYLGNLSEATCRKIGADQTVLIFNREGNQINGTVISGENINQQEKLKLQTEIKNRVNVYLLKQCCNTSAMLPDLQLDFDLTSRQENQLIKTSVGLCCAVLIYGFILFYSMQVMRSVIEEKSSRVIELIVTSVRPIQIMAGKLLGIWIVSLFQFLLCILLLLIPFFYLKNVFGKSLMLFNNQNIEHTLSITKDIGQSLQLNEWINTYEQLNIPLIMTGFFLLFVLGYFLYGSIFAALGALGDHETDIQQYILPVTSPLLISFMLIFEVLEKPDSLLAHFLSWLPFTSPVITAARLPFMNSASELILPVLSICAAGVGISWVAAQIYKSNVLVYNSSLKIKDIFRRISLK